MILSYHGPVVVFDLESTGPDPELDRIVEVCFSRYQNGELADSLNSLVNPGIPIPAKATAVHNITNDDVADAPPLSSLLQRIRDIMFNATIVGYNIMRFDLPLLKREFIRLGDGDHLPFDFETCLIVDVYLMYCNLRPGTLEAAHAELVTKGKKSLEQTHRANDDIDMMIDVLEEMQKGTKFLTFDPVDLDELSRAGSLDLEGHFKWDGSGEIVLGFGKFRGRTLADVHASSDGRSWISWACSKVSGFARNLEHASSRL